MKKKLFVEYEIDTDDYEEMMKQEGLTLEECVGQLMDDGELELNDIPIQTWRIEDKESGCELERLIDRADEAKDREDERG